MLEVNNIYTNYGLTQVLMGVSLEVKERAIVVLLGRNGMGKTTTIHSIIGFVPPCSGVIRFKEKDIKKQIEHLNIRFITLYTQTTINNDSMEDFLRKCNEEIIYSFKRKSIIAKLSEELVLGESDE